MSDDEHDAAMREIAVDALRAAGRYRRYWERGAEWKPGAAYLLDAAHAQILLAHGVISTITIDEIAESLGLDEGGVRRARRKLQQLGLLKDLGRHPDAYRKRISVLTPTGWREYERVVARLARVDPPEDPWA